MAFVETKVPFRYGVAKLRAPHPLLSIVIPTWNGGRHLSATLAHMREFRSSLDFKTELVIVDDCSERRTARIATEFADENELTVVLRNETNRGIGHDVARGMINSAGVYRIFVDSDLAYPSDQITKLLRAL